MRIERIIRAAPLLALWLTACKLDLSGLDVYGGQLTGISVSVDGLIGSLPEVGDNMTLSAYGDVDGLAGLLSYDPVYDASWTVSDTTIARVETVPRHALESRGNSWIRLHALKPGTVQVRATARGKEGTVTVRVIPRVARIDLLPVKDTITVDELTSVAAFARDAADRVITDLPLLFEADSGVWVGPVRPSNNVEVKGLRSGSWTVSARFRGVTGRTDFVVVPR
jgi:hypothetical protein